jgi:hypothetical protein
MTDTPSRPAPQQEQAAPLDAIVGDIHAYLDANWCQCAFLPDGQDCHWHKLFNVGIALQALNASPPKEAT